MLIPSLFLAVCALAAETPAREAGSFDKALALSRTAKECASSKDKTEDGRVLETRGCSYQITEHSPGLNRSHLISLVTPASGGPAHLVVILNESRLLDARTWFVEYNLDGKTARRHAVRTVYGDDDKNEETPLAFSEADAAERGAVELSYWAALTPDEARRLSKVRRE